MSKFKANPKMFAKFISDMSLKERMTWFNWANWKLISDDEYEPSDGIRDWEDGGSENVSTNSNPWEAGFGDYGSYEQLDESIADTVNKDVDGSLRPKPIVTSADAASELKTTESLPLFDYVSHEERMEFKASENAYINPDSLYDTAVAKTNKEAMTDRQEAWFIHNEAKRTKRMTRAWFLYNTWDTRATKDYKNYSKKVTSPKLDTTLVDMLSNKVTNTSPPLEDLLTNRDVSPNQDVISLYGNLYTTK